MLGAALFFADVSYARNVSVSEKKIGLWSISSLADDKTKRFSHCAASITFDSGFTLIFGFSGDSSWRIGWQHGAWGLTSGEKVTFATGANDATLLTLNGIVRDGSVIVGDLPRGAEQRKVFGNAKQIVLEFRGKRNVFAVDQIDEVLKAGFTCSAQGTADTKAASNDQDQQQRDGSGSSSKRAKPPESVYRADAEATGAKILSSTGLSDFRQIAHEELNNRNEASKRRWNWHALFTQKGHAIGIRMFGAEDAATLREMKGRASSDDNEVCINAGGRFLVEMNDTGSQNIASRMRSLCLQPASGWEMRYVFSERPGGGGFVVASIATYSVDDFGIFDFKAPSRKLSRIDDQIAGEVRKMR